MTRDGTPRVVDTIVLRDRLRRPRGSSRPSTSAGATACALDDAWADGAQAYLGITTAGFPNLFMLYGPNTNNGSIISMIECQVDYLLRHLAAHGRARSSRGSR